jgi:hypothetical protein
MVYAFDSGSGIHGQINRAMCPGTFVNMGVSIKAVVPHVRKEMISRYERKRNKGNPGLRDFYHDFQTSCYYTSLSILIYFWPFHLSLSYILFKFFKQHHSAVIVPVKNNFHGHGSS